MAKGSPFPGMDPYAEQAWSHVHGLLIAFAVEMLNAVLEAGLVAAAQQRVIVETESAPEHGIFPDISVRAAALRSDTPGPSRTAAATAEPRIVQIEPESYNQRYIEILDARSGKKLLTVIEFVSPSNKRSGEARRQYEQKQAEVCASRVSLVEIDLIRGGAGITLAHEHHLVDRALTPYHVSVRRGERAGRLEIYDIALRDTLPAIRVPLRAGEADVALDLQELFDQTYRRGRCLDLIDYDQPLKPPLPPADARWAAERIAAWRAAPA